MSAMTWSGGGRASIRTCTVVDRWAWLARASNELLARRPPTSQITRIAWSPPKATPPMRSTKPRMLPVARRETAPPIADPMASPRITTARAAARPRIARHGCS